MIGIKIEGCPDCFTLRPEGEIACVFVLELEETWRALQKQKARQVILDLAAIVDIDAIGRGLLRVMHQEGVVFVGARLATQDTLDEVTASNEPGS